MKPNLDKIIQDNLDKAKFQSKLQPSLPKNTGWLDQYARGGTYISGKALATQFGQYPEGGQPGKKYLLEKVENWVEPKYISGLNSEGHYGYNGKDTINYDPNSQIENINNPWWLEHERYHHFQTLSGKNPKERRQRDVDEQVQKMIKEHPDYQFLPKNKLISGSTPNAKGQRSFIGAEDLIYENPKTLEGEARLYEDYIENGGKSIFPELPKQKKYGGLLDEYDDGGQPPKKKIYTNKAEFDKAIKANIDSAMAFDRGEMLKNIFNSNKKDLQRSPYQHESMDIMKTNDMWNNAMNEKGMYGTPIAPINVYASVNQASPLSNWERVFGRKSLTSPIRWGGKTNQDINNPNSTFINSYQEYAPPTVQPIYQPSTQNNNKPNSKPTQQTNKKPVQPVIYQKPNSSNEIIKYFDDKDAFNKAEKNRNDSLSLYKQGESLPQFYKKASVGDIQDKLDTLLASQIKPTGQRNGYGMYMPTFTKPVVKNVLKETKHTNPGNGEIVGRENNLQVNPNTELIDRPLSKINTEEQPTNYSFHYPIEGTFDKGNPQGVKYFKDRAEWQKFLDENDYNSAEEKNGIGQASGTLKKGKYGGWLSKYEEGGEKNKNYVSLKNNKDWFDSHANWTNTGNDEYDAWVRNKVLTGRFGVDPKSNALIKLPQNEWTDVPDSYKEQTSSDWGKKSYYERFNSETPAGKQVRKDALLEENRKMLKNPVTYAPAAVLAAPFIAAAAAPAVPIVSAAMSAPIAGVSGLTTANLLNAGFAYQGAKNIPNVYNAWENVYNKPTWSNVGNATTETALTGLDMLPFLHGAYKGIPSVVQDINQAGNYLTTQTPLKNTYKINPWAFKPNPEAYYRGIGRSGLDDALEKGILRPPVNTPYGKDRLYMTETFGETNMYNKDLPKYKGDPFGEADDDWIEILPKDSKRYVAEIPKNKTNFVIENDIANTNSGYSTIFPKLSDVKLYKQDWLQGYKEVPKPTTVSSSVETMPPPSQTSIRDWLDDNATFVNLEKASPKPKSKMYKASEVVEDPSFNIKKIYRGDKETPKVIKVQGKSGEWTVNRSKDGSYYFNAAMSNPLESGKAMLKINEMLPPKPVIIEPNSLSLDSYKNVLKLGQRPHWKMEFENYIPLNHSAIHNNSLGSKFGFKPEGTQVPFNSLEDANSALKEVNTMLKKQGITQEADIFSNGNNNYGIKIPNFKLTRDYKNGGPIIVPFTNYKPSTVLGFRKEGTVNPYLNNWLSKYDEGGPTDKYVPPTMPDLRPASESTSFQKILPNGQIWNTATSGNNKEQVQSVISNIQNTRKPEKEKELAEKETAAKELALRKQASQVMKQKGNTYFTFPNGDYKPYKDMNFREKSYVEGLALDQDTRLNKDEDSVLDFFNPLHFLGSLGKGLAQAPYVAKQTDSYLPYVTGIGNPLLAGRMMGSGSMNPLSSKMWTNEISNKEFANILAGGIPGLIEKSAPKAISIGKTLYDIPRAESLKEAMGRVTGIPLKKDIPRLLQGEVKPLRVVQDIGRLRAKGSSVAEQMKFALENKLPEEHFQKIFDRSKEEGQHLLDTGFGEQTASNHTGSINLRRNTGEDFDVDTGWMEDMTRAFSQNNRESQRNRLRDMFREIDQAESNSLPTNRDDRIVHTLDNLENSTFSTSRQPTPESIAQYREQINLQNGNRGTIRRGRTLIPGDLSDQPSLLNALKNNVKKGINNTLDKKTNNLIQEYPYYSGEVIQKVPNLHLNESEDMKKVFAKVFSAPEGIQSGDVFMGSDNTSHSSYLPQLKQVFKYTKGDPQFVGYKPMNTMGFLSKYGYEANDVAKYLNSEIDELIKRGKLPNNIQRPFLKENRVILPQYGIKQHKYGGDISIPNLNNNWLNNYIKNK